jgi:enoyl-CoA hydratase/carnithine racemase
VPTIVGAMRLPGRIGWSNAMEILLTGERFGARQAKDMGLVWRVTPPADLMGEARALAGRLVQAAPLAQRATKEMAARGPHLPWEDALRLGESMRRVVGGTEDAAEGMQAAREQRDPSWRGR